MERLLDRPLWQIFAISLLVSALSGMVFGKASLIIIPLGFGTLPMLPGLIFVLLLADLFLALILVKKREFRSSLTWKEYSVKALDWLALWAGRLFLLVIA